MKHTVRQGNQWNGGALFGRRTRLGGWLLAAALGLTMLGPTPQASMANESTPGPAVVVDPTSIAFGDQQPGTVSSPSVVTVTNSGDAPLTISSVSINGPTPSEFVVSENTCVSTVGAGTACTISVVFTPSSAESRSATLTIVDNAAGSPHVVSMTGNDTATAPALSQPSFDFGGQVVGAMRGYETLMITNTGDRPLFVKSLGVQGANPGDFEAFGPDCVARALGDICGFSLAFRPTAAGIRSATLVIAHNAPNSPLSVTLTGYGVAPPAPAVVLAPTSLNFGTQMVGKTSYQTVTVTNSGNAALNISRVAVEGTGPVDFSVVENHCVSLVPASANCTILVGFYPNWSGLRSAVLVITDNAADSPQSVPLSGTGMFIPKPLVDLRPSGLDFGVQTIGTTSGSQTVALTNTGDAPLSISSVGIAGTEHGDYTMTGNTCGASVTAGASCDISVAFRPTATGSRRAILMITDNAEHGPHSVELSGTGVSPPAPAVDIAPTSLSFGDQTVGSTSGPKSMTVTNTGNATLSISSVDLAGASPGDYVLTSSTCGSPVPVGANCAITVAFRPTSAGARSAAVVITDDAADSPHVVALTGAGVAAPQPLADVGVSIGATPNPVRTGTTLTYTITVSNFGPSAATGVVLTEQLPAESKFVSYKTSNGTCTAPAPGATGTLTCQLGSLPVGSTSTDVVVKVVAPGSTSVTNTATVTSTSNDPNLANNSAIVKTAVFGRK